MNNKPVAWMDYLEHSNVYDLNVSGRGIPLYTHPAKTLDRELLDKTIIDQQNEIKLLREQLRWALIAKEDVGHNFNTISLQLQQKEQEK